MRDGVYWGPHNRSAQGKSHYTYALHYLPQPESVLVIEEPILYVNSKLNIDLPHACDDALRRSVW